MTAEPDPVTDGKEPHHERDEQLWLARERDAAWTAKLVILRLERTEDILHFGDCLREHETHIRELAGYARTRRQPIDSAALLEPTFVTREPQRIGALAASATVLAAMEALEAERVARYPPRDASVGAPAALARILVRHRGDAEARLGWLRSRLRAGETVDNLAAQ